MRTILALTGGSKSDEQVFATALAAAKPLGANLEFFHVRIARGEAARNTPHVDFARGSAMTAVLRAIDDEVAARSAFALRNFKAFCAREGIPLVAGPVGVSPRVVSAILESGRPVLIAPTHLQRRPKGAAVLCWKETPEAARALAVATPLLKAGRRVVILNAEEGRHNRAETADGLAERLKWNDIEATTKWLPADGRPVAQRLCQAVIELDANLVVLGAYGHSRGRESILGGCTRQFLGESDRPVLLMH